MTVIEKHKLVYVCVCANLAFEVVADKSVQLTHYTPHPVQSVEDTHTFRDSFVKMHLIGTPPAYGTCFFLSRRKKMSASRDLWDTSPSTRVLQKPAPPAIGHTKP